LSSPTSLRKLRADIDELADQVVPPLPEEERNRVAVILREE
jgi:hypothetical protein